MDEILIQYKSISVDDDRKFHAIVDIYNQCFGKSYKKGAQLSSKLLPNGYFAWFPKMAKIRKGKHISADTNKRWLNILDDTKMIITEQDLVSPSTEPKLADKESTALRYVFAKFEKEDYKFIGIFRMDLSKSTESRRIYRRIGVEADLSFFCTQDHLLIPESKLIKTNENEDDSLIRELSQADILDSDQIAKRSGKPKIKQAPVLSGGKAIYPRDRRVSINALLIANNQCEVDTGHLTFIRKNTNINYMEPHHLVPMAFSDRFEVSLDIEENIVSLCSNCHNEIHYGRDAEKLIRKLYDERKEMLYHVGIDITIQEMLLMYGIGIW